MDIFISWSGSSSQQVGQVFYDWLPNVIQATRPFIAGEIEKGNRWQNEIGVNLEQCKVGLICVTADNLTAPWLNFEAGALSKSLSDGIVCTVLLGLKATDVPPPLGQFQATIADDKEDIFKLLKTINQQIEGELRLQENKLKESFNLWWPNYESRLNKISKSEGELHRSDREIIEEILNSVRGMDENLNVLRRISIKNSRIPNRLKTSTHEQLTLAQVLNEEIESRLQTGAQLDDRLLSKGLGRRNLMIPIQEDEE